MATFFQYWQTYGIWSDTIHSAPEHSYPIGTVIFLSTCQLRILISALWMHVLMPCGCFDVLPPASLRGQMAGQLFLKPRHHTDTSRAIRPRDPNWHERLPPRLFQYIKPEVRPCSIWIDILLCWPSLPWRSPHLLWLYSLSSYITLACSCSRIMPPRVFVYLRDPGGSL